MLERKILGVFSGQSLPAEILQTVEYGRQVDQGDETMGAVSKRPDTNRKNALSYPLTCRFIHLLIHLFTHSTKIYGAPTVLTGLSSLVINNHKTEWDLGCRRLRKKVQR